MKSKSIKSLISKYYNKQLDSIEINVSGNDIKLTHESLKDVHPEILDYLSVIVKQKLQLIKGQTLREFVQDYKLIKSKGVWYTFKDKSGTGEVGEVKIKLDVNDFKIIEKKSIGTHITRYKFEREKWSKTKYVLQSVSKDIYEGTHSVNIETKVIYKQSKKVWVPSQIDTKTTHTIPDSAGNKMVRKLEESFQFYDYKT